MQLSKLSFTNIWGFCSNFVECESFLESNSPDILALCETNFDDSIDSGNFSVRGYLLSITHMHGLEVYVKEGLPFARDLSIENSADSYLFFRLALLYSVSHWVADTFKFSASTAASEFCEWVQVGINVYIPHHKYKVKLHSPPWFSSDYAAIVHSNHFFLYQQN